MPQRDAHVANCLVHVRAGDDRFRQQTNKKINASVFGVCVFVHSALVWGVTPPTRAARPLSAKSCKHDEPLAQTRASANNKIAIDPFKSASA